MSPVKPYRIVIEWDGAEDFHFTCDYAPLLPASPPKALGERRSFPTMVKAMGNVLRKLRREHISFPLFLAALAFNHARLLGEIDELLQMLHGHIRHEEHAGSFTCYCSSSTMEPSSSSSG